MTGILGLVVTIVIVGLIFYLCFWAIGAIGLPEPFAKIVTALIVLAAVVYLIGVLTGQVPMIKLGI
jgi:hypothetical protein